MDILTTGGAGQMRAFWRQSSLLHLPPPPPNNNNNNPTHFRIAATTTNNYSLGNPSLYLTRPPPLSWRWGPRSSCTRDGVVDPSSSPLGLRERLPLGGEVEDADAQQLDNPESEIGGPDPDDDDDHHKVRNAGIAVEEADVRHELMMLSLPAIAGQAIDPLTQLMETAYIGRLGPVELGSAGVSITIFNVVSKLFNIPLLSVATSFVAEDISKSETEEESASDEGNQDGGNGKPTHSTAERKQLSSVSTALLLASGIGIFEALALFFGSGLFLNLMGIHSGSPMRIPAQKFLSLRSLGAPAVVLSLALQGIFRGFKDTKTPVFCLGFGNLAAVVMFPVLMYSCKLGVTGAAISTVLSQYLVTFAMLWQLNKRVVLLPPNMGGLQFGVYMKSGGFLIGRTLAVLTTMTLATSMAARQGPIAMAAHQICMQVWLAVSLLTDALAASGQAMIASYISKGDYKKVREVTNFVLMVGVLTGVSLAAILGLSFSSMSTLFTNDSEVLNIVRTGVLFVSGSQPINALAFIFDGLHYGVSDFPYAACSMMFVGALSSVFLLYAPTILGLRGVWSGLALFMGLRAAAGYFRLLSKTGPWWFMHKDLQSAPLVAT